MKSSKTTPPLLLDWFISGICKHEVFEIVQGDLYELYERNLKKHGALKARLLYIRDALTILRPTLLKQLEGNYQLNPYGMFKNHFKTSCRNLKRNPLFTIINAVGLAISISVGIMIIVFLSELYSVDDFHEQKDQIYRVTTTQPGLMGDQIDHLATASYFVAAR
ncbi:MAG: permease prefix domain 2-containing transporter [Cytophagales bacterium]|nr:permease prefix domain 2-containing transporter [Cytophagales bacterium]